MRIAKMLKGAALGAGLGLGLGLLLAPRSGAETRRDLKLALGSYLAAWEARLQAFPLADIQLTSHYRWPLRRYGLGDVPVRVIRRVGCLSGGALAPADREMVTTAPADVPGLLRVAWVSALPSP